MTSGMRVAFSPDTVRYLRGLIEQALDGHDDARIELLADLAVMFDCEQAEGYESEDAAHDAILRGLWAQWGVRA